MLAESPWKELPSEMGARNTTLFSSLELTDGQGTRGIKERGPGAMAYDGPMQNKETKAPTRETCGRTQRK